MTDTITWQAVISGALLALIAGLPAIIGAWRVEKRSNHQDHKLDKIEQATNGGVQELRDKIIVGDNRIHELESLLKQAIADLKLAKGTP